MKFLFIIFLMSISFFSLAKDIIFPENFEFGVANAPVHVEDDLNDIWSNFADQGKVRAYKNIILPHKRLEFWSKPEIEISWAKKLGVKVFRVGVDWQRLYPENSNNLDQATLKKYKEILKLVKKNGMKVMLTLFHHSEPKWTLAKGGWSNRELVAHFGVFSKTVFKELDEYVDYWITFNEPNVYMMFSRVVGNWPPGESNPINLLNTFFYKGDFFKALDHMALAHNEFYEFAHKQNKNVQVSIAHNTANYISGGFGGEWLSKWSWNNMNFYFPDLVKNHLDFMGFNYYGAEYLSFTGLKFSKRTEYNDAGRAISPNGFYKMVKIFYERYKQPIFITENGTADADDFFRPLYLIEHLKVLRVAINKGIPVMGYIHWTLTDNFEWSDGYCPKFGLLAVDRKNQMQRIPRNSFYLFQKIIFENKISKEMQMSAFELYKKSAGKNRKMCRHENAADALDRPRVLPLRFVDWRLGKNTL